MPVRKILRILPLLAILILTACAPAATPKPAKPTPSAFPPTTAPVPSVTRPNQVSVPLLEGTHWVLVRLGSQPALSTTQVTLNFELGKVGGKDGCNSYGSTFTQNGIKLNIDKQIVSTMMACMGDGIMTQAADFIKALADTASFSGDSAQITLFDAAGTPLAVFTAHSTSLAGTSWSATGVNNGKGGVVSLATGTQITANFGTDGKVSGKAGCNNYSATYEVDGSAIKISLAVTTKMMCHSPAGVMEQEAAFIKALQSAASYRIDAGKLELRGSDQALMVSFATSQ